MFKCFKFIDEMMKQLNEADEMPMDDDTKIGEDDASTEDPATDEDTEVEGNEDIGGEVPTNHVSEQDPSQIADVDMGTFVSPITKANWANIMLKILKDNNPDIIIPTQFETVTTENADQIIEFVKNASVVTDDEFGNNLNNI